MAKMSELTQHRSASTLDGSVRSSKSVSGAVLAQHAMSKPATLTSRDARRIVRAYLSEKQA